jgi:PTH1 family peptidyl-tRNA hydrolase
MDRTLIVGLGNPGPRYAGNRHNVGFMALERLADDARIDATRKKFKGLFGAGEIERERVVMLAPQTFMNLSGQSVQPCAAFFDVSPPQIIVIHDELDLPFGTIRLKIGGGHAGHNGLRNIVAQLGTNTFVRLRVGIGRPQHGSVSDFVLSDFSAGDERAWLPDLLERSADAIRLVLREGARKAMNTINAS